MKMTGIETLWMKLERQLESWILESEIPEEGQV